MSRWDLVIMAFVLTAAIADLRWRKIPRVLTIPGLIVGLLVHAFTGGLLSAIAAASIAFAVTTVLFFLRAFGGGDVKLVTALGAMLGVTLWSRAMFVAIVCAALMGLVQAAVRGALWRTLRNTVEIGRSLVIVGFQPHPTLNIENAATIRSPFAVAVAIGTIAVLIGL